MKTRRKAREATVQALYQCDTINAWNEEALQRFLEAFYPASHASAIEEIAEEDSEPKKQDHDHENREFALVLMRGVLSDLEQIDRSISGASSHWSLSRMARVDRNILRLATFELLKLPDIPPNVVINEAIELAKIFGTDESPMFVNGVLDHISKSIGASRGKPPSAVNE